MSDDESIMDLLEIKGMDELKRNYREWVEKSLGRRNREREPRWTESIAVGCEAFVEKTKAELGIKAIGREVTGEGGAYELREPHVSYNGNFASENRGLSQTNTNFWNTSV